MLEMDRLLVLMQRAFAQHIARAIQVGSSGRVVVGGSDGDQQQNQQNQNQQNQNQARNQQQQQQSQLEIDQEALESFDTDVQNAIDALSKDSNVNCPSRQMFHHIGLIILRTLDAQRRGHLQRVSGSECLAVS